MKHLKVAFAMLAAVAILLSACSDKKDDLESLLEKQSDTGVDNQLNQPVGTDADETDDLAYINSNNVITWGIPEFYRISDKALNAFNKRLAELGCDFSLQFVHIKDDPLNSYFDNLKSYESVNGSLDIAFSGTYSEKEKVLEIIKSGYYTPLDEFLNSTEGEKLKDLYDSKLWSSEMVDNSIFLVPIGVLKNEGITFAFNKAYVSEKDLEGFEGDILQLEDMMKKLPFKEGFSHLVYDLDDIEDLGNTITELIKCDYRYGLLLSHDVKRAWNPYEYDDFKQLMVFLNNCYKNGYMAYYKTSNKNPSNDEILKYLKSGNFFVYIGFDHSLTDLDVDMIKYHTPAFIRTRLGGTGIAAASGNKEDAFKLLALAYTDRELANLLVYGLEGEDYILKDGVAYSLDGGLITAESKQLYTGIYEMVYPNMEEHFVVDRMTDKKNFYRNEVIESPYLGFNFYDEDYMDCARNIHQIVMNNLNIWKSDNIDAEFERVNNELKEAGIDALLDAVNAQLDKREK